MDSSFNPQAIKVVYLYTDNGRYPLSAFEGREKLFTGNILNSNILIKSSEKRPVSAPPDSPLSEHV